MKTIVLPPGDRAKEIGGLVKYLEVCHKGKPVRVQVAIAQPDKTPAQNRYLWAVPYAMLEPVLGMEKEDLHEWNCGAQWGWTTKKVPKKPSCPDGWESVPIRSTTIDADGNDNACTAEEMTQLWERMQRLGARHDVIIPDPDPDYWKKR